MPMARSPLTEARRTSFSALLDEGNNNTSLCSTVWTSQSGEITGLHTRQSRAVRRDIVAAKCPHLMSLAREASIFIRSELMKSDSSPAQALARVSSGNPSSPAKLSSSRLVHCDCDLPSLRYRFDKTEVLRELFMHLTWGVSMIPCRDDMAKGAPNAAALRRACWHTMSAAVQSALRACLVFPQAGICHPTHATHTHATHLQTQRLWGRRRPPVWKGVSCALQLSCTMQPTSSGRCCGRFVMSLRDQHPAFLSPLSCRSLQALWL